MSADALLSAIETEFITKDVAMNNRMASVELSLIRKIFCGRSKDIKYIYIFLKAKVFSSTFSWAHYWTPFFFSSSKHFLIRGRLLIRVESRPFLFALLGFWRSETPEEAASLSVVEVVVAKRQNPKLENVGGFDDVCVGRSASGVVREARAVGATGKPARDHGARGDVFGHLGEKLAAVAGERVRGDDGEPDTKRC